MFRSVNGTPDCVHKVTDDDGLEHHLCNTCIPQSLPGTILAEAGKQDDGDVRVMGMDFRGKFLTRHLGHDLICDDEVKFIWLIHILLEPVFTVFA